MHIFKDFERQPITYFSIDFFYKIGFKGKYRYSVSNEIVITKRKSNVQHIYPRFWMGGGGGGARVVHVGMFVYLSARVTQKLLLRLT